MKRLIPIVSALLIAGLCLLTPTKAAVAYSGGCGNFYPGGARVVHVTVGTANRPYVLTENGSVWAPCGGFMGDASGGNPTGRASYFQGRNADYLRLYILNGNVTGYVIVATSGEVYHYGSFPSNAYGGIWSRNDCASFVPQRAITHISLFRENYYLLLQGGGVWSPCDQGDWFGDASNGTTGSQPYFQGRTASYMTVCLNASQNDIIGYTIVATSGENYNYGQTYQWSRCPFSYGRVS